MSEPFESIDLPDGRRLAYLAGGDVTGYPVVGLHGTPGCRLSRWPDDSVYSRSGTRYITTDRAGYGQSSRHPGRTVRDEAADVLALADALGLDRFGVVGGSGGGPHALACAALLGGRVERVACQSGLAPLGPGGLRRRDWLAGMSSENVAELEWAEAGEQVLERELAGQQSQLEGRLAHDPRSMFEGLGKADRDFLARQEVVEAFGRIVPEQALHGVWGAVDDNLAFVRPWGVDLESIEVPVLLTYGLLDALTPPSHGGFLAARIRAATVVVSAEGGHMPLDPESEITKALTWLRTGTGFEGRTS